MADDIFAFQTPPFAADGSAKFFYLDAPRRRILADLIAHVCDGEGPILLVAESGMGKTMLLDRLAEETNAHNIRVVFSLAEVAAIAAATETDSQPPTAFLLDDGNALPLGVWHQLIALLGSESPSVSGATAKRLPPIVIALTPDLLAWLAEASLVPRSTPLDRVFRLPPFAPRDVGRYISLRLRVAGIDRPTVFSNDSVDRIALITEGVPVRINRLCEAALAEAARRGRTDVSTEIVEAAVALVEPETPKPMIAPPPLAAASPAFEPSPEPPFPSIGFESAPSIGIVGTGYGPREEANTVRRRIRRRRIPRWSGVAIAVGVAGFGAVAMLGYLAGPNAPRPSAVAPAATTGDAAVAALDSRPLLPPTMMEPNLNSSGPVPILAQPSERDDRPGDLHRDVLHEPAGDLHTGSRSETSSPAVIEKSTPPAAASAAPTQSAPAPGELAVPAQTASTSAGELPVTALPSPVAKTTRSVPNAARPQPRVVQPRGTETAEVHRRGRIEEPVSEGETESVGEATDGEGRPRPVKELVAMGDEFRDAGDTEWARRLYRAAQERGSAKAAVAEAETYDPQYAAASSRPDPEQARRLYSDAARQGDRQAARRLEELDQWMSERAIR